MPSQILKVTFRQAGSDVGDAYFRVAEGQEETAKNFVAAFAHNASLKADYELISEEAGKGFVVNEANFITIERIVAERRQWIVAHPAG